jgi:hypothetical protein
MFYFANGGIGSRSWGAPNENIVTHVLAQFTQTNGAPPTMAAQLQGYPGIDQVDPAKLQEMINAYGSSPDN